MNEISPAHARGPHTVMLDTLNGDRGYLERWQRLIDHHEARQDLGIQHHQRLQPPVQGLLVFRIRIGQARQGCQGFGFRCRLPAKGAPARRQQRASDRRRTFPVPAQGRRFCRKPGQCYRSDQRPEPVPPRRLRECRPAGRAVRRPDARRRTARHKAGRQALHRPVRHVAGKLPQRSARLLPLRDHRRRNRPDRRDGEDGSATMATA